MQNDPRMSQVLDYIKQNGGNPEQVFYAMAKERGFDPQRVLDQVRSFTGIR